MTKPGEGNSENQDEAKLARRDWLVLPLLGLFTVCIMLVGLEVTGEIIFPRPGPGLVKCWVLNDASTGPRGIPGCVATVRPSEGRTVEYKFNRCGHRAGMDCGDKPAGVYRIVMVGSSFAFAYEIDQDKSFAALLPQELTRMTGHKIELYNEGMDWETPHVITKRFNEVLAAQPDMILWVVTSWDVARPPDAEPHFDPTILAGEEDSHVGKLRRTFSILRSRVHNELADRSLKSATLDMWEQTRTAFLLEHLLYESRTQYVRSSLEKGGRPKYLEAYPDADWQMHLKQFDSDAEDIESRAQANGVPVVVALVPNREQAALLSVGSWPADVDPYRFGNDLKSIVERHGGTYVDILPDYRTAANPEQGYFPVDGHPNVAGHAAIAQMLAKGLRGQLALELNNESSHHPAAGKNR